MSSRSTRKCSDNTCSCDEKTSGCSQMDMEETLTKFREKWLQELSESSSKNAVTTVGKSENDLGNSDPVLEAGAKFLKGAEMERVGKLDEAIKFYRRAVQLKPDIEYVLNKTLKNKYENNQQEKKVDSSDQIAIKENECECQDSGEDDPKGMLLSRIEKKMEKAFSICTPKSEQKSTHISDLPTEIILYILRWVISSDLDLKSLEMFSGVCRGFYLCSRDPEIWKSICKRTWGLNCDQLSSSYSSWRDMFLQRTHLNFNGCYISRTSYVRPGEQNFQDQFNRPWYMVGYYRYFRFFPDGLVLIMTTADHPKQCLSQLTYRNVKDPSIYKGHYRLKDDIVTVTIQREGKKHVHRKLRRNEPQNDAVDKKVFQMEFQIQSYNKNKYTQLIWKRYSIYIHTKNGTESTSYLDTGSLFPPLCFSRVKSYMKESESPLI